MLVAVMVTVCAVLMTEGAVYNPFDRLPTDGLIDQVTAVFELPATVAVNRVLCAGVRVALSGLMLMLTMLGSSCTVTLPRLEGSATLVAVTVTVCAALMTEGAVYNPFDRLPTEGNTDQVTAVLELPLTVAANCWVCEDVRSALEGLTNTLTALPSGTS